MTTPNERRIRAGYDLFLAARPDEPSDWGRDSPVAALIDEGIDWFDDAPQATDSNAVRHFHGKGDGSVVDDLMHPPQDNVLARLRQLRSQMCCQILTCIEDETKKEVVHTVDHALKADGDMRRPHFCASRFTFNGQGKVIEVRYCSGDLPLGADLPPPPQPPPQPPPESRS